MNKQEAVVNLSTIFNRGVSDDSKTDFFKDLSHEKLLGLLIDYITNSFSLIGNPKITNSQALNDHGVDIIIEFPNNTKVGIQVKSPGDVADKDFVKNVKAQLSESQYHKLDKWYLLICSPIIYKKVNYGLRINHLINEFSSYGSSYHTVYNPQQCFNIFNSKIMSNEEFKNVKNQFFVDTIDWNHLLSDIKMSKNQSYLKNIYSVGIKSLNAEKYADYIGYKGDERITALTCLTDLFEILYKLTINTRELLFVCIERAKYTSGFRGEMKILCHDIKKYLSLDDTTIQNEIAILENNKLAFIDSEDGLYYINIQRGNQDYHILNDIKEYASKQKLSLRSILVDLDFSLFDK